MVGSQALPEGHRAMLLRGGVLVCLTAAGSLASVVLDTHGPLQVLLKWLEYPELCAWNGRV